MRRISHSLFLFFIFLFALTSPIVASQSDGLLVLDKENKPLIPKHFRTTSDPLPASKNLNTTGLANLHIAGSAQFSEDGLQDVLNRIPSQQIVIIDLRQESHGLLNGNAISWYGVQNAANAGLTHQQIEDREANQLNELAQLNDVSVHEILEKSKQGEILKTNVIPYHVKSISSEAALIKQRQLTYERFYVQDHRAPEAIDVDNFIQWTKRLPKNTWLYFHCRAGEGRTTTFMAMYDMMRNAKKVSFDDILARHTALGGKDLQKLPAKDSFKYPYAVQRLSFLKEFYQYCKENNDNFATSWTDWLKG